MHARGRDFRLRRVHQRVVCGTSSATKKDTLKFGIIVVHTQHCTDLGPITIGRPANKKGKLRAHKHFFAAKTHLVQSTGHLTINA